MESKYLIFEEKPSLRDPVLLMAFSGWSDAAESATEAATYLIKKYSAKRFSYIDPENYFEFCHAPRHTPPHTACRLLVR